MIKPSPSSEVINALPNIQRKKYLELGIDGGSTFLHVRSEHKVGVDIEPKIKHPNVLTMTTDDFFKKYPMKFDIIYIDACHSFESVVADYNNAVIALNKGGIILVHDLVPASEEDCKYDNVGSGTGYKFLLYLVMHCPWCLGNVDVCSENHGLTIFSDPKHVHINEYVSHHSLTYHLLQQYIERNMVNMHSHKNLCLIAETINGTITSW